MKFWKQILLTTFAFLSIGSMTLYVSCEKDQCSTLQCQNGGTCVAGICQCQTGYEGATCGTRSIDRYLGTYTGTTTYVSFGLLDTIVITPGNNLVTVNVSMRAFSPDMFSGTIHDDQTNYSILVAPVTTSTYTKTVNITLYNNQLVIKKAYQYGGADTSNPYVFIGDKK
jgi:hypothetical protein